VVAVSRRAARLAARPALASIVVGLGLAFAAAELAPLPGPPLYDGVVTVEPYRWLDPPPGQPGGAAGNSAVLPVTGDTSPLVAIETPEDPPQAQLFAAPGALTLPPGTTSLTVSISPVEATTVPANGHVAGNVYRVTVVNQEGIAATAPASASVSLVLRSPDLTTTEATTDHIKDGVWQALKTDASGPGPTFISVVTEFGDFALTLPGAAGSPGPATSVEPGGSSPPGTSSPTPSGAAGPGADAGRPPVTIFAVAAIALVLAGLLASAFLPRRKPRGPARRPPPRTRR